MSSSSTSSTYLARTAAAITSAVVVLLGEATAAYAGSVPKPSAAAPPGSAQFQTILNWVAWGALAACVVGVIVVGGRMAMSHRRGDGGEHAQGLGTVLVGCVIVGSAASIVGALT